MNSVPFGSGVPVVLLALAFVMQAAVWVAFSALGAWIAIRFEKWREGRRRLVE